MHAQSPREFADGQRRTAENLRRRGIIGEGGESGSDFGERGAVIAERDVGSVDEAVGGIEVAAVDGAHDLDGGLVAVTEAKGEEGAQGLGMRRRVAPVAGVGTVGGRQDAGVVVVADGLGRQAVLTGQVDGSQRAPPFEVLDRSLLVDAGESSLESSTIASRGKA